jgi:hypothetical protein
MSFVARFKETDDGMRLDADGEYVHFTSYFFIREFLNRYRDELERLEVEITVARQQIQKLSVRNQ